MIIERSCRGDQTKGQLARVTRTEREENADVHEIKETASDGAAVRYVVCLAGREQLLRLKYWFSLAMPRGDEGRGDRRGETEQTVFDTCHDFYKPSLVCINVEFLFVD